MSSSPIVQTFDLSRAGESGARAIVDALRIDRLHILAVDLDPATQSLRLEIASAEAAARTETFVQGMLRTHRKIGRKIVRERRARALRCFDLDDELQRSPDLTTLGEGLTGLRGPLLALFRFFEREFRQMAREFEAEENHYPTLIPSEILAEVGYFQHFPQHVTVCCHLPDSLPILEGVAAEAKAAGGQLPADIQSRLAPPAHVLTPGVCLPCYRQFRGVTLQPDEVRTLTMQNHVFRYEGANFRPLTRGWDFTVRDIVFFGSYEAMQARRLVVMDRTMDLCEELDLEVTIELANDPFFLDVSRDKAIYQRMGEVKYELLFQLPFRGGEALAAASFNLHRDFYTSVYRTQQGEEKLAESACMGFGVDRWVYGFLSQKGLDPQGWPERVVSQLE